ncbi:helix-turn-helix transcriptional regulator [Pseudoxanthomonas suwonensis]|uniref:helix-turn-helix transcriptional regulator n=1 Tax=Pseudoxanthomonas suwonensis TaxID=314722 RepID=UPI0012DC12B1|nr:helix-turn-helix transcriptional regulator [Pseudoxanthomonas suwonensis]
MHRLAVLPEPSPSPEPASTAPALQVLRLSPRGRPQVFRLQRDWLTVLLPLTGHLQLRAGGDFWSLPARHVLVWRDGELSGIASGHAIGVSAPLAAWSRHSGPVEPLPWEAPCPRSAARALLRLVRAGRDGDADLVDAAWPALAGALLREQSRLLDCLARCTGRTLHRRKQTLLRLLRAQSLIRRQVERRPGLQQLAGSANYSPHHLLRIYRQVFGETPSEYAARLRLQRAWRLVRHTQMPICEIADSLGFESQSAYCRAFKQAFGVTATQARKSGLATRVPRPAPSIPLACGPQA